jgi:hypothetical protein
VDGYGIVLFVGVLRKGKEEEKSQGLVVMPVLERQGTSMCHALDAGGMGVDWRLSL